ncbi:hypothetical protein [Streptomyces sp. NPDC090022]|uniref:hypothetical protein n=1 Tax=Streptomyces sp. NPDC090022 TaxID=3365920 RepID=UPI003828135A
MRCRRFSALIAPVLVSSIAVVPSVAAHPASAAVPAGGACALAEGGAEGKYDLSGEGFSGLKSVTVKAKGFNRSVPVVEGSFDVTGLGYGQYSVHTGKGRPVQCSKPAGAGDGKTDPRTPEGQYAAGYKAAFEAVRKSCEVKPPAPGLTAVDPNFEKGHAKGAEDALKAFCKGGQNEGTTQPAEVATVTASASPSTGSVKCEPFATITTVGTITSTKAGRVIYRWVRSDKAQGQAETLTFDGPETKTVTTAWQRGPHPAGTVVEGWEQIEILNPNILQKSNQATFKLTCS